MSENKKTSLDHLKDMSDIDLVISKDKLDYESMRTPQLHNKWLRMLFDRKERLLVLDWRKRELTRDKWLYYNGKADASVYKEKGPFSLKVLKSDLSMFIDADKDFHNLEAKTQRVKSELEFIQSTLNEINRRSFHISNSIKTLRFMNGEI